MEGKFIMKCHIGFCSNCAYQWRVNEKKFKEGDEITCPRCGEELHYVAEKEARKKCDVRPREVSISEMHEV